MSIPLKDVKVGLKIQRKEHINGLFQPNDIAYITKIDITFNGNQKMYGITINSCNDYESKKVTNWYSEVEKFMEFWDVYEEPTKSKISCFDDFGNEIKIGDYVKSYKMSGNDFGLYYPQKGYKITNIFHYYFNPHSNSVIQDNLKESNLYGLEFEGAIGKCFRVGDNTHNFKFSYREKDRILNELYKDAEKVEKPFVGTKIETPSKIEGSATINFTYNDFYKLMGDRMIDFEKLKTFNENNLKEAMDQYVNDNNNFEITEAKKTLIEANNKVLEADRQIREINEKVKPYLDILKHFEKSYKSSVKKK